MDLRQDSTSKVRSRLVGGIVLVFGIASGIAAGDLTVEWKEDFEDEGWSDRWAVDLGTWQVGAPAECEPPFGPETGYESARCAATVVCGNYDDWVETRFAQTASILVPEADESPRLRFWHWYRFSGADYGEVHIRPDGGEWTPLPGRYVNWSTVWARRVLDLSEFGGQRVRIGFFFHSEDQHRNGVDVNAGWYVDDVELVTGEESIAFPEGFESGLGDWWVTRGAWEVGAPVSGPGAAFSGDFVAATVLAGNYEDWEDSTLLSPPLTVPAAAEHPRLRFDHWYRLSGGDYGEVYVLDEDEEWHLVSERYINWSTVWVRPSLDLTAFAGQRVRVGFFFHSEDQHRNGWDVNAGWYVDNVDIVTGEESLAQPEGFEEGLGDWSVTRGTWQVGDPEVGPGRAHTGEFAAATVLAGNYEDWEDSTLLSPSLTVPAASEQPRLRFDHWYRLSGGDYGEVYVVDTNSEWHLISDRYINWSTVWVRPSLDLSAFAGETVRIGFFFHSEDQHRNGWDVNAGWYVDNVEVVTGEELFDVPESFESGLGDWSVTRGTWEVGAPSSGPGQAMSGDLAAATVLAGTYEDWEDSTLVSPRISVPAASENPRLRFWQWYRFSGGDYGEVYVIDEGGEWHLVSGRFLNWSTVWVRPNLDLASFAGQRVRIGFFLHTEDQHRNGWDVNAGWYIDDVEVETGDIAFENPEGFEGGLGGWSMTRGAWEVGAPTGGPGAAFGGDFVAATVLAGNYEDWEDSTLLSPRFVVPPSADSPRLRFRHWYRWSGGDYGEVYVIDAGDEWHVVSPTYSGSSGDWTHPSIDLSDFAGETVRLGFFFHSEDQHRNGWDVNAGWYIDDVTIEPIPELPPFRRGDSNGDLSTNVADPVHMLNWLFGGGVTMLCQKAADVDDSGGVNITDAVFLLRYLFADGRMPAFPYSECGDDPTPDALSCALSPHCSPVN